MDELDDAELDAIQKRADAATAEPWWAWVEGRDGTSGDTFIAQGGIPGQQIKDLYLSHYAGQDAVIVADHDFIAHARQDVPRLVTEIRRLRRELRT
jgi:hypothetical protein